MGEPPWTLTFDVDALRRRLDWSFPAAIYFWSFHALTNFARRRALPGFLFRLLFLAEDDFALPNELIIEPEPVFVRGGFQARAGRAA
jgi:hypothetical protein